MRDDDEAHLQPPGKSIEMRIDAPAERPISGIHNPDRYPITNMPPPGWIAACFDRHPIARDAFTALQSQTDDGGGSLRCLVDGEYIRPNDFY